MPKRGCRYCFHTQTGSKTERCMSQKRYSVRFETEGADLFVELEGEAGLNRQHLLAKVVAILEDRHGMETIPSNNRTGEVTRVIHSDGSTLLAWLCISGDNSRQALDDDGLDEILTCLAFLLFPPVVETSVASGDSRSMVLT